MMKTANKVTVIYLCCQNAALLLYQGEAIILRVTMSVSISPNKPIRKKVSGNILGNIAGNISSISLTNSASFPSCAYTMRKGGKVGKGKHSKLS